MAKKFIAKISTIKDFKEWKNAKVKKIITCYDVDDSKSAYVFELEKNGKYAGYIVVSAKKTNYPVLEFSKGMSPLVRASELGIKAEKVYRLGGLMYFVKEKGRYHNLGNGKEVDFNEVREEVKKAMKNERVKKHLAERAIEAKEQWEKYSSNTIILAWYGVHIQGVPNLYQPLQNSCSPTASAMVLGYWDQHGYPNFPDDYQYTLIYELADAMGLSCFGLPGTCPWNIAPGINEVCNNHDYSNWASTDYWVSWSDVTDEIDASRPFVPAMTGGGTGSGRDKPYGQHSVACVGYAIDTDTNEKFLLLHDTWTPLQVTYLAFGDWLGAWEIKVRPT